MFEFPDALSLPLADLREALFHNHDVWQLMLLHLGIGLVVIELLHIDLIDIVTQHCVIEVDVRAQVSVNDESTVTHSEFTLPGDLQANHTEFLAGGCSRSIDVEVDFLHIKNDELSQLVS